MTADELEVYFQERFRFIGTRGTMFKYVDTVADFGVGPIPHVTIKNINLQNGGIRLTMRCHLKAPPVAMVLSTSNLFGALQVATSTTVPNSRLS